MDYTVFPGTDLKVSRIALGCWTFSGGSRWGDVDDDVSVRAVHAAMDAGINLFDTAEVYGDGRSEQVLGRALAGRRTEAVIATKVHYRGGHYGRDRLIEACEASLRRLQVERIDVYQLHWPVFDDAPPEETVAALNQLKDQGKIGHVGVCNFGARQLTDFLPLLTPVSNQLPYSPLWRGIEENIVPATSTAGLGILAYSGLVGGLLSGKYTRVDQLPEGRRKGKHLATPDKAEATFRAVNKILALAKEAGMTAPDLTFAWILSRPGVTSVLAGARTPEQARANASAPPADSELIDRVTQAGNELLELHGPDPDFYQTPGRIQ